MEVYEGPDHADDLVHFLDFLLVLLETEGEGFFRVFHDLDQLAVFVLEGFQFVLGFLILLGCCLLESGLRDRKLVFGRVDVLFDPFFFRAFDLT